jgi:transposase-like protein
MAAASQRCSRPVAASTALWAVIMEAYVHGVSTRKVEELVTALGIDHRQHPL